jgi:hypothetical protein
MISIMWFGLLACPLWLISRQNAMSVRCPPSPPKADIHELQLAIGGESDDPPLDVWSVQADLRIDH